MIKGKIHSIETMGLVDGPGVRTIFFLQGCPLRCAYCHNPDTQAVDGGTEMSPEDVLAKAKRFRNYYGTEGGITFSGGEPLLQGEFVAETFRLLKENNFNTCLDTSGYGDPKFYKKIFPYVDTILLDVKAFKANTYQWLVDGNLKVFLNFMENLENYGFVGGIWLRHVMIPGLTDNDLAMVEFIEMIKPIANLIERIEILPYHTMGIDKYAALGRKYRFKDIPAMNKSKAKEFQHLANQIFAMYIRNSRCERKVKNLMSSIDKIGKIKLKSQEIENIKDELNEIPLIKNIMDVAPKEIWEHFIFFNIYKGDYIFRTGDLADYMYIICRGHAKIFHNTVDGKEQILYIYNKGDFVGGLNVLSGKSYLYMGQAMEDCLIAAFPKQDFDLYVLNNPEILQTILNKSFDRIRWAEELIGRLSTSNATMKAAALLLRLKDNFGIKTKDGIRLDLAMNREEMGNYSGLTRETITRKLGEFKDLGYIDIIGNKTIIIKNLSALEDFCF